MGPSAPTAMAVSGGKAYSALRDRTAALPRTPVLPEAIVVGALSAQSGRSPCIVD
jgi:hypothetical protein